VGRAQKLKQERREQEARREQERRSKRRREWRTAGVIVLAVLVAGGVFTALFLLWPRYYEYRELVLETARGEVRIELLQDAAPATTSRIAELAGQAFYDGTNFHRVEAGIVQGGDPNSRDDDPANDGQGGSGTQFANEINYLASGFGDEVNAFFGAQNVEVGQAILQVAAAEQGQTVEDLIASLSSQEITLDQILESWRESGYDFNQAVAVGYQQQGYTFDAELPSAVMTEGMVAMANSGPEHVVYDETGQIKMDEQGSPVMEPGTNDSQFFIIREYDRQDLMKLVWRYKHTVFGRVVSGMDVVQQLQKNDVIERAYVFSERRRK
jgi:cyclophilin family peptidyl-prolyl cis-trans isomerase